ncbi:uncharacterized protein MELLADRAFT_114562 [Melampsora larici-populina 98AG31]|uniref:CxC1-like cysteine cluster associated with KDZ transposases domain-containing protein n=1 Tax=Melampsora larici-populina (strain 98AG31 / pathotype 3-4-7) TaxID=747676 RepID=F4SDY7_MELLP|nr:uncharacterized protein MELLADRAFT_114562 [Melampsora larici-populina 98AG31]EGF97141.1 hypothetical protein MELLADRAFT_114562 [Melampsora larici-populina 98AG31]
MPQRVIHGINHHAKPLKPVTALQQQLLDRRRLDEQHAENSQAALLRRINADLQPRAPVGPDPEDILHEEMFDPGEHLLDDEAGEDLAEGDGIDLNQFMPARAPPNNNVPEDPIAAALQRERHLADRLAHEKKWTWQYAIMLPTFLRSRRRVKVAFCKHCDLSDPARLLQMGYMAASPSKPRTAFLLRLLVHHHSQWVRYAVPTEGYCDALDSTLNSHSPVILTAKGNANPAHTLAYFKAQWARQRDLQLRAITTRTKDRRQRLEVLVLLEEELLEARYRSLCVSNVLRVKHSKKLAALNATNAEIRTAEQRNELLDLPGSLASLEAKMQEVAEELGNTELLNVRRRGNDRVKAVMTVQVALGFLYEAKFDVIQQFADAALRTGATQQPRNEQLRTKKRAQRKKKLETYLRHAKKYNQRYRRTPRLAEPSLDDVQAMDLLDPFWDEVALVHQDEPWASCQSTKDGIVAFRSKTAGEEELRRLGREVRQLIGWAVDWQRRIDEAKPNEANGEGRVAEWKSVHRGLSRRACLLWKRWERGLLEVVQSTQQFVGGSVQRDGEMIDGWQRMVASTAVIWQEILGDPIFMAEEEDDGEDDDDEGEEVLAGFDDMGEYWIRI